LTKKRKK